MNDIIQSGVVTGSFCCGPAAFLSSWSMWPAAYFFLPWTLLRTRVIVFCALCVLEIAKLDEQHDDQTAPATCICNMKHIELWNCCHYKSHVEQIPKLPFISITPYECNSFLWLTSSQERGALIHKSHLIFDPLTYANDQTGQGQDIDPKVTGMTYLLLVS